MVIFDSKGTTTVSLNISVNLREIMPLGYENTSKSVSEFKFTVMIFFDVCLSPTIL